jgi:ornithine cyclodeaminase/alanine dehydrogenase-like protein (mu-crystallin family)
VDPDAGAAARFAAEMQAATGIDVTVSDLRTAAQSSDICVSCTPSDKWFLGRAHVRPGTFIAAVGADNPEKQELEPELLGESIVVVDSIAQCAEIGELHHAISAGAMRPEDVHATLGQTIAGLQDGRTDANDVIVFDSSGIAVEDIATAVFVYEAALREGRGLRFDIAA